MDTDVDVQKSTRPSYQDFVRICHQTANSFSSWLSESIAVSDPYVPERMFAVVYGAALSTWSDTCAVEMREGSA